MKDLLHSIRKLFGMLTPPSAQALEEAYLAGSHDIYDLEHRMRELERRQRGDGRMFMHLRHY